MDGIVKWFDSKRGFGFIKGDDGDYFCHFSAIKTNGFKNLVDRQVVRFTPTKGDRGLIASDVEIIS